MTTHIPQTLWIQIQAAFRGKSMAIYPYIRKSLQSSNLLFNSWEKEEYNLK